MTSTATRRTLSAPIPGPMVLDLDMPHGQIDVRVCDIDRAEIDLTTAAPPGSPAGEAIADATVTIDARVMTVHVPAPEGGTTIVTHARGGRVVVSGNVTSGVVISGGDIHIAGGTITGGQIINGAAAPGVRAVVRLPRGSALQVRTKSADLATSGPLEWARFASVSGDLSLGACRRLNASSTSGDLSAGFAEHAEVRTVSGDIYLDTTATVTAGTTSGDITISDLNGTALLRTVSGDITVNATPPGQITAHATSGDIRITAPPRAGEHALTIDAHSLTGRVRTPATATGPTRSRRPRFC
ncbi:hypothetical protein DP939_23350 [Spongiactinospora rosea]|uniref:DUF4097 domain-containing protein n=1 Tax=Spongiactinospora rosea TaxID=2248750 RepID=A0A366LV13_9ACTN|nr:DUF4097 family beta strand repeat-containing protein [Spongiactinospora rosea]RBQ17798.1 hypothetical protein DP939_23350 [Spongiactinospora rosea]